jgi:hypothetical protein
LESVLLIGGLVAALTVIALWQGGAARAFEGWERGGQIAWSVLPNLVLGFAAAGLIVVVVPPSLIGAAIGDESGMRGLLIATIAGILTPGGPFLQFPLVAALAKGGAAPGPLAAYLTAWSLIGQSGDRLGAAAARLRFHHRPLGHQPGPADPHRHGDAGRHAVAAPLVVRGPGRAPPPIRCRTVSRRRATSPRSGGAARRTSDRA